MLNLILIFFLHTYGYTETIKSNWNGITPELVEANSLLEEDKYKVPKRGMRKQRANKSAIIQKEKLADSVEGPVPKIEVIIDSSGSMGQLLTENKTKMYITKKVISRYLIDQWREKSQVGMRVYGSRRRNDCNDSFLSVNFNEQNINAIERKVSVMMPVGKTPLHKSIKKAMKDLKGYDGPKRIVIFTDGKETCGGDPCKLGKKIQANPDLDIKIYVVAIGFDPTSEDYESVKCLGGENVFNANNEEQLFEAVASISDDIKKKHNNLKVISPSKMAQVILYKWDKGKRVYFSSFTSYWGTRVPPGTYDAEVVLNPYYKFPKFTIKKGQSVTLKVDGYGEVYVSFVKGLMDGELLDKNGKVIHRIKSDRRFLAKTGKYKLRVFKKPFYTKLIPNFLVVPNGKHKFEINNAAVVIFDHPTTQGLYIYDINNKLVGSNLTNIPIVLKAGTYKFYIDSNCMTKNINLIPESDLTRISCNDKPTTEKI